MTESKKSARQKAPFYQRATCNLCGSTDIECVVELGTIPCISPNVGASAATSGLSAVEVPLDLYLCHNCGHIQVVHIVDPALQYLKYQYQTSISLGLRQHFEKLVERIAALIGPPDGKLVAEMGSNDGTVLGMFQKKGCRVIGVDPATEIAQKATERGIPTVNAFFTQSVAERIAAEHGKASAIIANNVLANIDDLSDVMGGISALLAPDGIFVFETGYGGDVITSTLLDTIYHEHISYFVVRSLPAFLAQYGLELIDAEIIASKGGSLRAIVQHRGGGRSKSANIDRIIAAELAAGLDGPSPFKAFSDRISGIRNQLAAYLDARAPSGPTIGYGASVGSVTLINYFHLTQRLDYVADDNPLIDALRGPDYEIPVSRSERIYTDVPAAVVVLAAWRYIDPIKTRHQRFLSAGGEFAVPLPDFAVHRNN
jgi:SAM-dependent methyltransferase